MSDPFIQGSYIDWETDPIIYFFLVFGFLTIRFFLNKFFFRPLGKYMIKIDEGEETLVEKKIDEGKETLVEKKIDEGKKTLEEKKIDEGKETLAEEKIDEGKKTLAEEKTDEGKETPEEKKEIEKFLKGDLEEKKEIEKFVKYCWHGSTYVVLWVWGIYILSQQSWSFDFENIWNFPHPAEEKLPFKWYIYVQIAWYTHGFIESLLVDGSRKDFLMMILHHVLSVCMLSGAYWGNYHRVAASVCAEQDISDIWIYFSKNLQKSQKRIPLFRKPEVLLVLLTVVTVIWFSTRVLLLGVLVYAGWMKIPAEQFTLLPRILLTQLTILFVMQTIWWIGLAKMWYEQFTTGQFHDMWHDGRKKFNSPKIIRHHDQNGNGITTNGNGSKYETNGNGSKEETNGDHMKID